MKRLTQIFQTLLGVVALIFTAIIAMGRLAWRRMRSWWQNRSKVLRCLMGAAGSLAVIGIVACVAYAIYDDNYGRYPYWDEMLSDNISLHYFRDGMNRVYDEETECYITPKIDWVRASKSNALAVYAISDRRGYVDVLTGDVVIDALDNDYQYAWVFSEGVAAVVKDDKLGFINADNEVVIPFQFEYPEKCRMYDVAYVFHNGLSIMTNEEGGVGLIDKSGDWVVVHIYSQIWSDHTTGQRVCVHDGEYGVLDDKGALVYPVEYDYISVVEDGFELTKDGRMWKEDFEGNVTVPFMYEWTTYLSYPVDYNEYGDIVYELSEYVKYAVSGRRGIMNRLTGEPITPAIYEDVEMMSKDIFEVSTVGTYNHYLVDTNGNVIAER